MPINHLPNLLIVDDSKANLILLEKTIKKINVNLIQALTGTEALEKIKGIELALAIIDVRMPRMNGYELALKINQERPGENVPIIFLTASHFDEMQVFDGYSAGAVDYIFKPFVGSILLCKINVFLDLFNQKQTIIRESALLKKSAGDLAIVNAALKRSEEKYRRYIDNAPDGVFVADETGKYLEVNEASIRMTGYSKAELCNMSISDLLPEESLEDGLANFREVVATGTSKGELLLRHKNGTRLWCSVEFVKLTEIGFLGFLKDIDKRKKMEVTLKSHQLKLEKQNDELTLAVDMAKVVSGKYTELYDFAPSGYFTLSAGKAIQELNHSGALLLGRERSHLIGSNFGVFISKETQSLFDVFFLNVFNSKAKEICEVTIENEGNQPKYVHIEGMVAGKGNQCLINVVEITELKQTEEVLRKSESNLAEAQRIAHIGSWELDIVTNTLKWSKEMYTVFDISPETFDGRPESLINVIHPDDVEIFTNSIYGTFSSGNSPSLEYRVIHKNGSVHNIFAECGMEYNKSGQSVKNIGTAQDITEMKISEERKGALEQMHKLSEYTEKVRENERMAISRELHDDLGQSLTAVKIDLALIKQSVSEGEVVAKINKVSDLVSETIKSVQRLTSQLRPPILDDLGIEAAIKWYIKEFAQRTGLSVFLEMESGIVISADASLFIFRIVQESLTNIARHARADRADIMICKTGDLFNFCISDNGIGITENEIKSKKSFGIISMKERTASMGGTFDIFCENGGGTIIKIIFPVNFK